MIPQDIITLTLKNIIYRKIRSWLTILGVIIGIAAVVALVSLGDAIQALINEELSGLGGDKLIITPGVAQQSFSRNSNMQGEAQATITTNTINAEPLTLKQAESISKLPNLIGVSPVVQKRYEVTFRSEYSLLNTQFVKPADMKLVEQPELIEGRWLLPNDKLSCVIGYNVAKNVFSNEVRRGDIIKVNRKSCRVVGVLKKKGGFTSVDDYVFININTIKTFVSDYDNSLAYIYVRVKDTEKLNQTENEITNLLLKLHKKVEKDFTILSFASIKERVNTITTLITAFLGGIAAISLLVGGIGISNTMFTSVMERTREIGIFKAIGAKSRDIMLLIISEAGIISLIGGVIGVIAGLGLAQIMIYLLPIMFKNMSATSEFKLVINPLLLIVSLLISFLVGIISGYLPAKKAASLNPIEAIWYE